VFGIAAFVSAVAAYVAYTTWFISVWCFFATVLSVLVLLHIRRAQPAFDCGSASAVRAACSSWSEPCHQKVA